MTPLGRPDDEGGASMSFRMAVAAGPGPVYAAGEHGPQASDAEAVFSSVLGSPATGADRSETADAPPSFRILNLDQILTAILAGKQEYNLAPFFIALCERSRPSGTGRTFSATWRTKRVWRPSTCSPPIFARCAIMSRRRRSCMTRAKNRPGQSPPLNLLQGGRAVSRRTVGSAAPISGSHRIPRFSRRLRLFAKICAADR